MILKLLLILSLNPAFAKMADCGPILAGQDLYAAGFEQAVVDLDRRGFSVLTEPYHNGDFKVKHASFGLPIDIRKDEILVRILPQGQSGTWAVAVALFEYATRKDFQQSHWFWPKEGGIRAILSSDILSYLAAAPANWRADIKARVGAREAALEKLYSELDQLKSAPPIPLTDGKLKLKFWMGNLLRAVMVGTTLMSVAQIPQEYTASQIAIQQQVAVQTHRLSPAQLRFLIDERDQLINGIHYQLGLPIPNQQLLTQMKNELSSLHAKHPELVEAAIP